MLTIHAITGAPGDMATLRDAADGTAAPRVLAWRPLAYAANSASVFVARASMSYVALTDARSARSSVASKALRATPTHTSATATAADPAMRPARPACADPDRTRVRRTESGTVAVRQEHKVRFHSQRAARPTSSSTASDVRTICAACSEASCTSMSLRGARTDGSVRPGNEGAHDERGREGRQPRTTCRAGPRSP
eukprot:scaffold1394_cov382-Prasinococcus_capsulatus_cf.AAC.1